MSYSPSAFALFRQTGFVQSVLVLSVIRMSAQVDCPTVHLDAADSDTAYIPCNRKSGRLLVGSLSFDSEP